MRQSVIHVDTERGWRGGQNQVALLHRGLLASGIDSLVVARAGSELAQRLSADGLPVTTLPVSGSIDPRTVRGLRRVIASHRPDVIHAHAAHAHGYALLATRGQRTPVVVTRRVDFVPRAGAATRWKYGHRLAALVAISEGVAAALSRSGIPRSRMRIIHSGVDPARLADGDRARGRASLGIPQNAPLVLQAAALTAHKGQVHLLDAWQHVEQRYHEAWLVIAGDGELQARLSQQIRENNLQRCRLLGWRQDIADLYAAADAFCMSSVEEGLGTSVIDAMMQRLPIVATRAGGIPELIDDQRGLLVAPGDPTALAEALCTQLADPANAAVRANAAYTYAHQHFTAAAMVAAYARCYAEVSA